MPMGKAAAQAGHAFTDTLLSSPYHLVLTYLSEGHGTKIILVAPDEESLRSAHGEARRNGLPCALIVDSGHVLPPHFDGSPILTALGIGPCTREQAKSITNGFELMR